MFLLQIGVAYVVQDLRARFALQIRCIRMCFVQMKDLINHDYLVLNIRPGEPKAELLHIMAHKLRGGIHITHIPSSDIASVFHEGVRCFTVDCGKREKKRIRLETLLAILKEEDPDYSLRNANCWDYAKNSAKRLVKGCVEVRGISSAERARLQTEHDNLEANLAFRHIQNVAKSLLRNVSSEARDSSGISTSSVLQNSSRAVELSPLPTARNSFRVSNSLGLLDRLPQVVELSSDPIASTAPTAPNSARVLSFSRAMKLDSSQTALSVSRDSNSSSEVLNSPRSVDLLFSPADPTALNSSRASNSSGIVDSSRAAEISSSLAAPTAPLASSAKLCLQIAFLMFCLIINNLGLGPWASSLLGGSNSG